MAGDPGDECSCVDCSTAVDDICPDCGCDTPDCSECAAGDHL